MNDREWAAQDPGKREEPDRAPRSAEPVASPTPAEPAPSGWQKVIADARLGLAAGGRSVSGNDFEIDFGGALIDKIAEGLELLEPATPQRAEPTTEQAVACSMCRGIGSVGEPPIRCNWCDGTGNDKFAAPHRPAAAPRRSSDELLCRLREDLFMLGIAGSSVGGDVVYRRSVLDTVDAHIAAILDAPESAPGGQS